VKGNHGITQKREAQAEQAGQKRQSRYRARSLGRLAAKGVSDGVSQSDSAADGDRQWGGHDGADSCGYYSGGGAARDLGGIIGRLVETCRSQAAEIRKDKQRINECLDDRLAQFESLHCQLEALLRRWEAEQRQGQEQD
jgi:hypothetical protein